MPRKKVESCASLGKQLIKTKQKKKFNQRKDDEPVGGYKVVSKVPFKLDFRGFASWSMSNC